MRLGALPGGSWGVVLDLARRVSRWGWEPGVSRALSLPQWLSGWTETGVAAPSSVLTWEGAARMALRASS